MKFVVVLVLISKLVFAKELITQIMGRTSFSVLTSRQVQINTAIEFLLFEEPKSLRKNLTLNVKSKGFQSQVHRTFMEMVIYQEAKTSGIVSIPQRDVVRAYNQVKVKLNMGQRLRQWTQMQPSSQEMRKIIEQKLLSKRFIKFKQRASKMPITDAEALRYFQENRSRFKSSSFISVKDKIKSDLGKEQIEKRLNDWFAFLLKKYKVQRI